MPFPEVRRSGILLFVPILLSLVGSLHRGEAGDTKFSPVFHANDSGKLRFSQRQTEINLVLLNGRPAEAIPLFQTAFQEAKLAGNVTYESHFLSNLGVCHLTIFQYPEALTAFIEARDLSEKAGDYHTLAKINTNISSIYLQMNNLDDARTAAERGLAALKRSGQLEWRPKLLIQLAKVLAKKGDSARAEDLFQRGIEEASSFADSESVALGWDCLGDQYRIQKRLHEADAALTEAFRLRKIFHLPEIVSSYRNLARLRLDQGDLHSADILMDQAVAGLKTSRSLVSIWSVYYERGRVRMLQGDTAAALDDFRTALQFVQDWRLAVIPTDDNRVTSETGLQQVYS
ncbi:MAG: tetratricopeptide repeat protein, partial [Acidobacteriota bacterium]|nr:tetratricopeptide repeat protein [Acidobacteriota bacterium]